MPKGVYERTETGEPIHANAKEWFRHKKKYQLKTHSSKFVRRKLYATP